MASNLIEQLTPVVTEMGYELWHLETGADGQPDLLRIYIDSDDGIEVDDCAAVSREIDTTLTVAGYNYGLEVSSPGVERPLVTAEHFRRFIGHRTRIKCFSPVSGKRRFLGWIRKVDEDTLHLTETGQTVEVEFTNIAKANLAPENWSDGPDH